MYRDIKNENEKILFFSGSNHSASINQLVVSHLAKTMGGNMAHTVDLRSFSAPLYALEDEEATGIPDRIAALADLLDRFDRFVIAVPENNGSVTAFFKNTLDWISRARKNYRVFQHKKVFLLAVAPGNGGGFAIRHAGDILTKLGAEILGGQSICQFDISQLQGDADKSGFHSQLQDLAYTIRRRFDGEKINAPLRKSKTAAGHKQVLIVWLAIYPLITLILFLFDEQLLRFILPVRTLILTITVVPAMAYIIVPLYEKFFANWIK